MADVAVPSDTAKASGLKMVINKSSMEVTANGNSGSDIPSDSDFKKPQQNSHSSTSGTNVSELKNQNGSSGSAAPKPKDPHHSSSSSSSKDKDRTSGSSSSQAGSSSSHKSSSSSKVSGSSSSTSTESKHRESSSGSSSSKHPSSSSSSASSSKPRDGSVPSSKDSSSSARSSSSKDGVSVSKESSSSSSKHRDGGSSASSTSSSSKPREGASSSSSSSRTKDPSSQSSSSSKSVDSTTSGSVKPESSSSPSTSSSKPRESQGSSTMKENDSRSKDSSLSRPKESSSSSSRPKIAESSLLTDNIMAGSQQRTAEKHSHGGGSKPSGGGDKKPSSDVKTEAVPVKAEVVSPVKDESLGSKTKVKVELTPSKPKNGLSDDDDDDVPLVSRISATPTAVKAESSDDDTPLVSRMSKKCESEGRLKSKSKRKHESDSGEDSDYPLAKRVEKAKKAKSSEDARRRSTGDLKRKRTDDDFSPANQSKTKSRKVKAEEEASPQKGKKKKKEAEEDDTKWKWWEEGARDESVKWKSLEHKGPVFAASYDPLPSSVKFYYDGRPMKLSQDTEEVGGFYGKMLEHDYTTRELFNKNFFKDWRKVMTAAEKDTIIDLKKCNFKDICEYYKMKSEERKGMTKEQKNAIKAENEALIKEYGFCIIDGHKQKIGNFRIEPPGLFRGRGDHPKQGMHKKRTLPGDVLINCSKGAKIPVAPEGKKWKEVRHDNTVTWLASWNENIQGATKYIMLNAASRLKGEKDWKKYETARRLHRCVDKIRRQYNEDLKSKEMKLRQRAVALYFIDKLALRAGNEKDEDTADTVGCCSLRFEHIKLHDMLDDKECVVEFDFPGKDSIRYYNAVPVEKRVYKNLQLFMENKSSGDDLFDRLNTGILNKHLQELMDGLSAKVFRTYNASRTLQEQLDLLTDPNDPINAKMLSYNRANRAVAILCNHQRAAPKNFQNQMDNLQSKIDAKKDLIKAGKKEVKDAKSDYKATKSQQAKNMIEKKQKALERLVEQLSKLETTATDKDENKEIALGTSKLNYLDPRISVAWCKKWEVPLEKVYNKTQREKFAWAIDMAEEDYSFI